MKITPPPTTEQSPTQCHLNEVPEKVFDDLTWLAARACAAPIAVMSVNGDSSQRLKSQVGLNRQEIAQGVELCESVLSRGPLYVVPDAMLEKGFGEGPAINLHPTLRFFAGIALIISDGSVVGTLSVMDRVPRQLSPEQTYALEILARQVVHQLEARAA